MTMEKDQLFDSELEQALLDDQLSVEKKKYLKWVIGLIVLNTLLFPVLLRAEDNFSDNFSLALHANLVGFNVFGGIIGGIVALFPYKGLSFGKKYVRSSLLSILCLQGLMCIGLLLIGIMKLLGWG